MLNTSFKNQPQPIESSEEKLAQAEKNFRALLLDLIEARLRLDNAFAQAQTRKEIALT